MIRCGFGSPKQPFAGPTEHTRQRGCDDTSLRYLLADHLSSTQGEASVSQSELAQRRYYPFGSDRAVSGASDLTRDGRFPLLLPLSASSAFRPPVPPSVASVNSVVRNPVRRRP